MAALHMVVSGGSPLAADNVVRDLIEAGIGSQWPCVRSRHAGVNALSGDHLSG